MNGISVQPERKINHIDIFRTVARARAASGYDTITLRVKSDPFSVPGFWVRSP